MIIGTLYLKLLDVKFEELPDFQDKLEKLDYTFSYKYNCGCKSKPFFSRSAVPEFCINCNQRVTLLVDTIYFAVTFRLK